MISSGSLSGAAIPGIWMLLPPAATFLYFAIAWIMVGRDPKAGPCVTQYQVPERLSPAAVRYIVTRGSDHKSLAAVLTTLACKQAISIEPQSGAYHIRKLGAAVQKLAPEEAKILDLLFVPTGNLKDLSDPEARPATDPRNNPEVAYIRPENNQRNSALVMAIQGSLSKQLRGKYFQQNAGCILLGVLISVIGALAIATTVRSGEPIVLMTLWFLFFSLGLGMLFITNLLPALRDIFSGRTTVESAVWTGVGLLIFIAIPSLVGYKIVEESNWGFLSMLVALLLTNLGWGSVMPSKTETGRKVFDQIMGFKHFLEEVETDRMDVLNHPKMTPQLLNDNLAYAIALDVKEAWGDHLSDAFFATTRTS